MQCERRVRFGDMPLKRDGKVEACDHEYARVMLKKEFKN